MTVIETLDHLRSLRIGGFDDIGLLLDELEQKPLPPAPTDTPLLARVARGVAFVTFAYDIDGVSMEIAKYGTALEALLREAGHRPLVHCVGGNFQDEADLVLSPDWRRFLLHNADGWRKWEGGRWFTQLFYRDMPEGSERSRELAVTIWSEAVRMAEELAGFVAREEIGLLIPVNVNSNPGNFALALAIVLVSEATGCPVLNNNHDFYWEGGRPTEERPPDHQGGPRDHFFHNHENRPFFEVFRRILPWNGRRWIQVNINPLQSRRLVEREGFAAERVFLVGTGIDEQFFHPCSPDRKSEIRRRVASILSGGGTTVATTSVTDFLAGTEAWMKDQRPVVCGRRAGTELDFASEKTIVLLQPTRVVPRKRIPRDWDLIGALLHHPRFREKFEQQADMAIVLLVTGPVPIEHRRDAEEVLRSYADALALVPDAIGDRVFHAFSVGHQRHPSLPEPVEIAEIYQTADMILFPSETEGRGLPIPEAAAAGVPIVCARYDPVAVFDELVGAHRPAGERLQYLEFPESEFFDELLDEITDILLDPASFSARTRHNQNVVQARFSIRGLQRSFSEYLQRLDS